MGLFKQMKQMKEVVAEAPGLIANAQQMQQAQMQHAQMQMAAAQATTYAPATPSGRAVRAPTPTRSQVCRSSSTPDLA